MTLAYAETCYEHIEFDDDGIPFIAGTNMKVIELVLGQMSYGWSPEELHFQYPHLSMGQIHSALAYYWDHRDEIEQDIERRLERIRLMEKEVNIPLFIKRLKTKKSA